MMPVAADIQTGVQPGLRFAALLDRKGGCRDLDWDGVRAWRPSDGFLWIHLERDDATAADWLRRESRVDPLAALALLAEESRPRVEDVDDSLLVVLRGVNVDEATGQAEMVPIHIWAEADRLISLRDKDHQLNALRNIRLALLTGKGPRSPGGLLAQIAERIVEHLELLLDGLEDTIGDLEEETLDLSDDAGIRTRLALARRQTVKLRRYLGPQRDALYRIQHDDASWLSDEARLRLREVNDKVIRHIEDLDALRDRATILHEDLSARISERIAASSNRFTAVAALLLPPSLVAGLLGANIGGIPGNDDPLAFWELVLMVGLMLPGLWFLLKRLRWL